MIDCLRVGIIGAGMMGCEHIRNLNLFPEVQVVALVDPVLDSLEKAQATLGHRADSAKTFSDTAAMLAGTDLDAVLVVTPNFTHRTVLEPLLRTDIAILCEKPLCTTVDDANWVAAQVQNRSAVFWTGMEYRFMPPVGKFIERVHGGDIGQLAMLSIREHRFPFLQKVGDWNRFNRNTGGTMVEKCCHFFDLMRHITGREAVSLFCSGGMDVNHLDERYNGERPDIIDNSYTIVNFEGGVRAMLDLCMFAEGEEQQDCVAAIGDSGKLEVTIPAGEIIYSPRTGFGHKAARRTHVPVDATALAAGTHHGSTYYQLRAFIDAVRGRGRALVTAQDGARAVAIGAAAELSARECRVVKLEEIARLNP